MDHKDFIVGKRYRNIYGNPDRVSICVGHTISGTAILETDGYGSIFEVRSPSSWAEVKEPREYWIVKLSPEAIEVLFTSEKNARSYFIKSHYPDHEIIHVREVV